MPEITGQQATALHSLEWLWSEAEEDVASGRTFVTALALLRFACQHPDRWVDVRQGMPPLRDQASTYVAVLVQAIRSIAHTAEIEVEADWGSSTRGTQGAFRVLRLTDAGLRYLFEEVQITPLTFRPLGERVRNTGRPPMRAAINVYLRAHPWATSAEIARELGLNQASVGSLLAKEVNAGRVLREVKGPRGGWGYKHAFPEEPQGPPGPTVWERLRGENPYV